MEGFDSVIYMIWQMITFISLQPIGLSLYAGGTKTQD